MPDQLIRFCEAIWNCAEALRHQTHHDANGRKEKAVEDAHCNPCIRAD